MLEDSKGNIWIGTYNGISVYNGIDFFNINSDNGLPEAPIFKIYEDSKQNIWAGSAGEGLYKIQLVNEDSANILIFNKAHDGIRTNYVFDICEADDNRLWLALFYGGVNILTIENDSIIDIEKLDADYGDIPSNVILSMQKDSKGDFWFGTQDNSVFKIIQSEQDKGKIVTYGAQEGFYANTIWDIIEDRKGNMWFASEKKGLIKQTEAGCKSYLEENGYAANQVLCLFLVDHLQTLG